MEVSINRGTPKWMVDFLETAIKIWMIWGYPYFRKPPYSLVKFQTLFEQKMNLSKAMKVEPSPFFGKNGHISMDWFSWENLNRKPWFLPSNIGLSCKISHHPIL